MFSFDENSSKVLSNIDFPKFLENCVEENGISLLENLDSRSRLLDAKTTYTSLDLMDGYPGYFCYGKHWFVITVSQKLYLMAKDVILISRFEDRKIFSNFNVISFPFMSAASSNSSLHSNAARMFLVKLSKFVDFPSDDIVTFGKKKR